MSGQTEGATVRKAHCDRCGATGTNIICIKANREGGIENWKPLCDDCLEELGKWFNHSLQPDTNQSEEDQ